MKSTTVPQNLVLPVHPLTGLRALGMSKRGPIWPILGGDGTGDGDTGNLGGDGGESDGDGADNTDGDLGDAGKKALDEERKARKAADKRAKDAEARAKALEDANKSDDEKAKERIAELEKKARRADQFEAAKAAGLDIRYASRINGDDLDSMIEDAKELAAMVGTSDDKKDGEGARKPAPNGQQGHRGDKPSGAELGKAEAQRRFGTKK